MSLWCHGEMNKPRTCKEIGCPCRPKGKRSCNDVALVCHPKNVRILLKETEI